MNPKRTNGKVTYEDHNEEGRPRMFNPTMAMGIDPSVTMKVGLNVGKEILQNSRITDYLSLQFLRPYFDISNKYVLNKIRYIFAPFTYKQSTHFDEPSDHSTESASPFAMSSSKLEYPDLYIPLMSFITYILLVAFNAANNNINNFNPDILGIKFTKNLIILILHTFILKTLIFIFCNASLPILDIMSYISYKFVLIVVNLILWILFSDSRLYYVLFIYTSAMSMLYLQMVLKQRMNTEHEIQTHQKLMIYLVSGLEIVSTFLIMLDI